MGLMSTAVVDCDICLLRHLMHAAAAVKNGEFRCRTRHRNRFAGVCPTVPDSQANQKMARGYIHIHTLCDVETIWTTTCFKAETLMTASSIPNSFLDGLLARPNDGVI